MTHCEMCMRSPWLSWQLCMHSADDVVLGLCNDNYCTIIVISQFKVCTCIVNNVIGHFVTIQ